MGGCGCGCECGCGCGCGRGRKHSAILAWRSDFGCSVSTRAVTNLLLLLLPFKFLARWWFWYSVLFCSIKYVLFWWHPTIPIWFDPILSHLTKVDSQFMNAWRMTKSGYHLVAEGPDISNSGTSWIDTIVKITDKNPKKKIVLYWCYESIAFFSFVKSELREMIDEVYGLCLQWLLGTVVDCYHSLQSTIKSPRHRK